jgi:hypothetical protein
MAITHGPGAEPEPGGAGARHLRAVAFGVAALVSAAVVVPFALHHLLFGPSHVVDIAVPAPHVRPHQADSAVDTLGPRGHLPPLLPAGPAVLRAGLTVRVGDLTEGTLRRTPGSGWQVVVRWGGRDQPLSVRGPVGLTSGSSWVSAGGVLYTRVATSGAGQFVVYRWRPVGASASTPPSLVAGEVGVVCFNDTFTAFGDCAQR